MWGGWGLLWWRLCHRVLLMGAGIDFVYESASFVHTLPASSSSSVSFRLCAALFSRPYPPQFSLTSSGRSAASGQAAASRWFFATAAVPRLIRYLFKGIRGGALSRGTSGLWVDRRSPYQESRPSSTMESLIIHGWSMKWSAGGWGGLGALLQQFMSLYIYAFSHRLH